MHGPPMSRTNSYGADLAGAIPTVLGARLSVWVGFVEPDPYPRETSQPTDSTRSNPQRHQRIDDHLLYPVHVFRPAMWSCAHRYDRVADQLSRTVIGDISATIGLDSVSSD